MCGKIVKNMVRKNFSKVNLTCIMQSEESANKATSTGVLSVNPSDGSFRFEEAVRRGRAPRNPKLFDGKFVSMVRMSNGRYQCYIKSMKRKLNREYFAFGVYSEICSALSIID